MIDKTIIIVFLGLYLNFCTIQSTMIGLYDDTKDDIEILNKTTFNSVIYGSDKVSFVEFYAQWCGACQRYSIHWKEIAKETKSWHSKVVRVAAINCADSFNDPICREHNVEYYPTLKLFPTMALHNNTNHDAILVKTDKNDALIRIVIKFVENQQVKPSHWPELEPYTSKRLDALFVSHKNIESAFLIFEQADSDLGQKLILDFSAHTDKILIRRVTPDSAPGLFTKLEVDSRRLPVMYLVNNTQSTLQKAYEKFDDDLIKRYLNPTHGIIDNNGGDGINLNADLDDEEDDYDDYEDADHKKFLDDRHRFAKMMRKYLKIRNIISNEDLNKLKDHAFAGLKHGENKKKEESQSYLLSIDDRVHMQDLESGLHLMLRSDIAHFKSITGVKLDALKEWLRVLTKYFPGRKPVKNFLKDLYSKVNSTSVQTITGDEWLNMVNEKKTQSFLPETIEWHHCKGSEPKFRGYPCSLWTLFHVLTVGQIENEKEKTIPFDHGYNVKEVIEAVIGFVGNFFSCKECSENFVRETKNRVLIKPYDGVKYLWEVHNRVNKRLARDEITEQDPAHPKILFPTKKQCPKCYISTVKHTGDLAEHESPWIQNEALLFLTSFYSKYQIIKIQDLPAPPAKELNRADVPIGLKRDDKLVIDKETEKKIKEMQNFEKIQIEELGRTSGASAQSKSDLKMSLYFFVIAITVFGLMFLYFNYVKKGKQKLKKHII